MRDSDLARWLRPECVCIDQPTHIVGRTIVYQPFVFYVHHETAPQSWIYVRIGQSLAVVGTVDPLLPYTTQADREWLAVSVLPFTAIPLMDFRTQTEAEDFLIAQAFDLLMAM